MHEKMFIKNLFTTLSFTDFFLTSLQLKYSYFKNLHHDVNVIENELDTCLTLSGW